VRQEMLCGVSKESVNLFMKKAIIVENNPVSHGFFAGK
jgi:hypothetical protein